MFGPDGLLWFYRHLSDFVRITDNVVPIGCVYCGPMVNFCDWQV